MSGTDGLTYKEFYSKEYAKAMKQKLSISQKKPNLGYFKNGQVPWNKGLLIFAKNIIYHISMLVMAVFGLRTGTRIL